jgi:acyl carrier protein
MAVAAVKQRSAQSLLQHALSPLEGIDVFERILAAPSINANIAVCTRDLNRLIEEKHTRLQSDMTRHQHWRKNEETILPGIPDIHSRGQKRSLPVQQRPALSIPYVAPRDKMEQMLAGIWQEFLVMDQVGIHDNFFELGASSLDIVQVNSRLEKTFNIQIPVVTMFTYPTIDELKKYLAHEETAAAFSQEEIQRLEKRNKKEKDKLKQRKRKMKGEPIVNE